jgi:hypothetical protein
MTPALASALNRDDRNPPIIGCRPHMLANGSFRQPCVLRELLMRRESLSLTIKPKAQDKQY